MAGKQLGKLRQWAGEAISVRDKTTISEEFKELEHDIELRRQGLWRLHVASDALHGRLYKKKACEAVADNEKLLPIDALGVVMIQHGEEFGDDSAFGTSLVAMGKAHCKVAMLQEAFALNLKESYITSLQRAEDEIKEYQSQRKKMDSRRLTYDAATAKVEKMRNSKKEKEKERKDAEDEYERAKARFEEITEDVRARMLAIQENELEQLRELTGLLDMEIHFVQQYLEVLKETKSDWVEEVTLSQMERSRKARPPPPPLPSRVTDESRFSSVRSKGRSAGGSDNESDAGSPERKLHKSPSLRKSDGKGSRPPSRSERKRADSTTTAASGATERGKEKEKPEAAAAKRLSIAGWASSISKMTGRSKKDKDKNKSDSLMAETSDDEDDSDMITDELGAKSSTSSSPRIPSVKGITSRGNTPNASPQVPGRILRPPSQQDKKIAVALHDFAAASSDELSFKAGDQITVVSEVIDGWWMGEHNTSGKTGLFPTTYTEILNASSSSLQSKPALPRRPSAGMLPPSISRATTSSSSDDKRRSPPAWLKTAEADRVSASDDDHPFGDNYVASSRSPLHGGFYSESNTSDTGGDDDNDEARLVPDADPSEDEFNVYRAPPPVPIRRPSVPSSTTKKAAPPPPPPRRSATTSTPPSSNYLGVPQVGSRSGTLRSNASSRTNSTNGSYVSVNDDLEEEFTSSPFDSPKDAIGCGDFKQNPFKQKGMCSNCFQLHG